MKREEAINIVRKNIPHLGLGATEMTEALESLIPELRESEDERIIEEIKFAIMQMPSEREDTKQRCLAYLEKQKEQKPAWSEEDERILTGIIERGSSQVPFGEPALRGEQMEWLMNRLKSLRPSWKPSEEQMRALDKAIPVCMGIAGKDECSPLISLYEQLKKL